jgi:hypothetical protein
MTAVRVFLVRLASLVTARRLDDRLAEELQSHIDFATDENVTRGMTPDAARVAALRSVGGLARTREAWRETRGFPFLTSLWQDVRYATRCYAGSIASWLRRKDDSLSRALSMEP